MAVRESQNSFVGGEFAPGLYGRKEVAKYATAVKTAKNFILHAHGPASNRPGTKYMGRAGTLDQPRIHPFIFSSTQTYMLEIGRNNATGRTYVRFYASSGQVVVSGSPAWLTATAYTEGQYVTQSGHIYRCQVSHTSGTFATDWAAGKWVQDAAYEVTIALYSVADIALLKFAQSADTLYVACPNKPPYTLTRYDDQDWRFAEYVPVNGPFLVPNLNGTHPYAPSVAADTLQVSAVTGTNIDLSVASGLTPFFDSSHIGRLFRLRHTIAATKVTAVSTDIKVMNGWRLRTHGTWTGTVTLQKSTDFGVTWKDFRHYTAASDMNFDTFGSEDNPDQIPFQLQITTSISAGAVTFELMADSFVWEGIARVTAFTSGSSVKADVVKRFGSLLGTLDWAMGTWGPETYPQTVGFYQDRLVWGGSPLEPQTLWMTKTGDYTDFGRSVPLLDSDGITVNLPSRELNAIVNMASSTRLIVLTAGQPFTVRPGADGILGPSSIIIEAAGRAGCSLVDVAIVNSRVVFVQPMGQVVRDLAYTFQTDSFDGDNLSIFANHLFRRHSITDLAYQEEPDPFLWCLRDDGIAVVMTYLKEQEVLGWARAETSGLFKSVATKPGPGYQEVWFVVYRGSADSFSGYFIEKLTNRLESSDPRQAFFLDAGLTYDSPKVITGATQANPVVVTSTAHGFANNDLVDISDILGMVELNGTIGFKRYKVAGVAANTFQLKDPDSGANIDGTAFKPYISGGNARKAVSTFAGLEHLEGKVVTVLADGAPAGTYTVAFGQITLNRPGALVHVGLGYEGELSTLKFQVALRDGKSHGVKTHISGVIVGLADSRGGLIGMNEQKLAAIAYPDKKAIPWFSGDINTTIPGNSSVDPRVVIRQTEPLPITVLEITPILSPGGT